VVGDSSFFNEGPSRSVKHLLSGSPPMDKKDKKHLDVLRQRQQKLQLQLAGAKKQADDPQELRQLEEQMKSVLAEIERLKSKQD
jgi:hypothetical protein